MRANLQNSAREKVRLIPVFFVQRRNDHSLGCGGMNEFHLAPLANIVHDADVRHTATAGGGKKHEVARFGFFNVDLLTRVGLVLGAPRELSVVFVENLDHKP